MIPVNRPLLDGNERRYLLEALDTGWISSEGPFVQRFEQQFAARVGRAYGVAVCNGTAALDLAVAALDLQPGDEIIVPTFTIIACLHQIVRSGLKPLLVDCDPRTFNMPLDAVRARLTSRTKAVMAVHPYGLPVDMPGLMTIAREHGLKVIEDAAEMHGQTCDGRPCGSFRQTGCRARRLQSARAGAERIVRRGVSRIDRRTACRRRNDRQFLCRIQSTRA